MQFSLRNALGIALLGAFAATTWLWSRLETGIDPQWTEPAFVPPGYYLRGAVLLGTDPDGQVRYRVNAGRAEEDPAGNALLFSDIEVHYAPAEQVPWVVSATAARGPADLSHLDLSGEVRLRSEPADREPLAIETASLRFDPARFLASSDDTVYVSIGDRRLSAVGLRAHLKDDRLELESQVHGQFLR